MSAAALCIVVGALIVERPARTFTLAWQHTVEKIVGLLIQRFQAGKGSQNGQQPNSTGSYRIKTHHMGAFRPGFDPHKLGQLPEDF